MKRLETDRLILRKWKQSDIEDFYEYARCENVGPSAGWPPHKNIEESQKILDIFIEEDEVWAIELKDEGKVIGSIGLHDRKPEESITIDAQREIGYVLNPSYWGRGIMPEAVKCVLDYAFNEIKMEIVWCGHYDFNMKSKRVVEKSGFNFVCTKEKVLKLLGDKKVSLWLYNMKRINN